MHLDQQWRDRYSVVGKALSPLGTSVGQWARTFAKELAYGLAHATGLPRHAGRHRGAGLVILTYHSVGPQAEHPYLNRMPPERFAAQLRYLKANYRVVSLEEGLASIGASDAAPGHKRPMVAITVDDGYSDNFDHLFPLAQAEGVPVAIFLATDYLDSGQLPWPTRIDALLHFATAQMCVVPDPKEPPTQLALATPAQRQMAGRRLRDVLSRLDHRAREQAFFVLERDLAPRDMHTLPPLHWEQVRHMLRAGASFGSHTRFHAWLDRVEGAEAALELQDAKRRIEQETETACQIIAYPNGNHSPAVLEATFAAGYRYALTQQRGINLPGLADPFALHRIEIPFNERLGAFACRVAGLTL